MLNQDKEKQKIELLDIAVELRIKLSTDDDYEKVKQILVAKFPSFSASEVDELLRKTGDLLWTCYEVAEKIRDKKITYPFSCTSFFG